MWWGIARILEMINTNKNTPGGVSQNADVFTIRLIAMIGLIL